MDNSAALTARTAFDCVCMASSIRRPDFQKIR